MLRGSLPPVKQQWFNLYGGGLVHMGCPTLVPLIELPLPSVLSSFSNYGPGQDIQNLSLGVLAVNTWSIANRAILYQITIPSQFTVRFFRWYSGAAVVGNFDMGIYDNKFALLRSTGSTPHPGANTLSRIAVSPLSLQPGSYWLAFNSDNGGFGIFARVSAAAEIMLTSQMWGASASFPLPATITPVALDNARVMPISIASADL